MSAPRSGNQKGSVERLVGWVNGAFFKPRKFLDGAPEYTASRLSLTLYRAHQG
jgi:hypothetical protein